jgi:hypothetical protein
VTDEVVESSARRGRVRRITIGATVWNVFEHIPEYDRRASATLVFASEGAMRRVRNFPQQWWDLPDDELLAISWRR